MVRYPRLVRSTAGLGVFAILAVASNRVCADDLIDENVRAQMLKHSDGRVAHLETEYNDLFIDKHGRTGGREPPTHARLAVDLRLDRGAAGDECGVAHQAHIAIAAGRALVPRLSRAQRGKPRRLRDCP